MYWLLMNKLNMSLSKYTKMGRELMRSDIFAILSIDKFYKFVVTKADPIFVEGQKFLLRLELTVEIFLGEVKVLCFVSGIFTVTCLFP